MATLVQYFGGTTAQHSTFTGPDRAFTVDTDKHTLVVHDGVTAGGYPLVKESTVLTGDDVIRVGGAASAPIGTGTTFTFLATAAAAKLISTDPNNGLGVGADGLLIVTGGAGLIADDDELLHTTPDGKIATGLELDFDALTGKFTVSNHAGTEIASTVVPTANSVLKDVDVVTDPIDPEGDGSTTKSGTYFKFTWLVTADDEGATTERVLLVDVSQVFTPYTAGDASIQIDGKAISVQLATGGGISLAGDGLKVDASALPVSDFVSEDESNILVTGADNKLLVKPYTAGDGITIDAVAQVISVAVEAVGNQITIVDGKLVVPLDYGTMD